MKKKILSLVLTVCMVLTLLPAVSLPASAINMVYYTVGETNIGDTATGPSVSASGDGWTWTYDTATSAGTLTLTDAYLKGTVNTDGHSYGAYLPDNTTIKLNGDSTAAGGAVSSGNSYGVCCAGNLTIENGSGSNGSLSAIGGNSEGSVSYGVFAVGVSVSSGKLTAIGGKEGRFSYGIFGDQTTVSGSADVTAIGGTAGNSCGVCTYALLVSGGSLTAVGGYASNTGCSSFGIVSVTTMTVSGGVVTAQGGKCANGSSCGVDAASSLELTGGLLVASSGTATTSSALSKAPTMTGVASLTGSYSDKFAVYGDSATYTSDNILTSTLDLSNNKTSSGWSNSTNSSGWKWDYAEAGSTLTLKNMVIVGTNETASNKGSFGILGGGNISIVYEGVNVVCGGTSESGDSCGIEVEETGTEGFSLSGDGTLIALGRQVSGSSCGIRFLTESVTGGFNVSGGKVIALGGDAGESTAPFSCGLEAYSNLTITGGDVTAVGGAAAGTDSLSAGAEAGTGISVSSGQLVAVGGHASGTRSVCVGACSYGTTIFSGDANIVAAGDGYGIGTYLSSANPDNFQLGTAAADTVTVTAMGGGTAAANSDAATGISNKIISCDGGTYETKGSAVRFRVADAVIAVAHNGSTYTNYANFSDGWNDAVGTNNKSTTTVKLLADWTATDGSFGKGIGFGSGTASSTGFILVPKGKTITLDLNGHTIDRGLTAAQTDGEVICIDGANSYAEYTVFTLTDSAAESPSGAGNGTTGCITGGYNSGNGGGIYMAGSSVKCTIKGGCISGNTTAGNGGGIVTHGTTNGDFLITGGKIIGNSAATGGGIYCTMCCDGISNCIIQGNTATTCGGGIYSDYHFIYLGGATVVSGNAHGANAVASTTGGATMVKDQGKITGGYDGFKSASAGGIFNANDLTLQGGRITGNKAINWGGGVRNNNTFTMTGGEISGNIANYDNDNDGGAGGVYNGRSFTMTGGEISGNYTCDVTRGGGVYNTDTFEVGGTAKITGNVSGATFSSTNGTASGGVTDNVYLPNRAVIFCLTGTNALASGASIGVTTYSTPTDNSPVAVTGKNGADYSGYFFSDSNSYHIEDVGSGSDHVVKLVDGAAPVISVTLSGTTTNYTDFVAGWNYAVGLNTSAASPATVKLLADWTADIATHSFGTGKGFGDGSANNTGFILVPQDKSIILDLNGHTIDRHLTAAQTDGEVICIASGTDTLNGNVHTVSGSAYLTVKDSTANQGKITGGRNKANGSERFDDGSNTAVGTAAGGTAGGIVVGDAKSMLTLEGGQITGNQSENFGGGVSVQDYGYFVMSGGTISGNTAGCGGGGVALTGELWLTGGSIVGNTVKGTFTGKDINEQPVTDAGYGGGVCAYGKEPRIYMGGGTISGNVIRSSTSYGAGIYTFFETYFGGDAKVNNNQKGERAVASTSSAATGGSDSNCYILPSYGSMYYLVFAYSLQKENENIKNPLKDGASIGIELDSNPTPTRPVELNATPINTSTRYLENTNYNNYFHCDNPQYAVKKSAANEAYTLQYAVASPSDIFGAKFYRPQVWDCQRSPAFPVADRSFRLSGLKAPYDENLNKVNFADPANDYVKFEYVKAVSDLDPATQTRIVNSLKRYTGATEAQITAAAVVMEVLHSGTNQETTTTLSSIGLVWALGNDGFLYTAMDGALKYSGGVGTYVTFAAHKNGDSIIYTPDKTEPYKKDEIDGKELAQKDGTPTAPAAPTYQELIRVVNDSGAVGDAMVGIWVNDAMYSGTTDANGCVQFVDLPVQTVKEAAVQSDGYKTLTYNPVDSPEAVLTYTNPSTDGSGSQQDKVTVTVNTTGKGTVSYLGAGASAQSPYSLTKDDTAMFAIKPASGYYVSAAKWGSMDILAKAKTGVYNAGAVTENTVLTVTFAEITKESIFNIKYTTAEVFDVQRSPAFPDTGDSSICFSSLDKPYDTNLNRITLGTGEYIKFDKVSSVGTAGKTDEYTGSLRWWTDATKIGTAAQVEENVYKADGTKDRTLGTGLIWCYNDPSKGFMFTTMDGDLGDCGGVGSYVSFNALRYGSSVTQLTTTAEPLQWGTGWSEKSINDNDPQGQSENPGGDTVDDTQEVTFDFAGKVLNNVTPRTVVANTAVTLTWAGQNYPATTDANGRFVVSGLPYIANGDYTVTISGKTFTGELPVPSGVENSQNRTKALTAPEIVFLLPSSGETGTVATPHTITVTKTGSGSVSPAGTVQVSEGGSARIGFAPSSGYTLSEVKIDNIENADAKTNGYCKFTGVTANHTVAVTFAAGGANPGGNPGSGGSGSSGSSGSTTTTTTTGKAEPVIVDNVEHDIGTKTTTDTTTTVTVDNSKLQEQLESAKESVIVPITTKTDTTVAQLVVKNVEDMAKKDMTLSVDIGKVQYNIPSTAVQTDEVMQTLGATDPSKVPVNVTITQLKNEDVTIQNGTLQVPPVQFTVTATYGGKTVETKVFTQYVNRVIELSDGTDLSKITTAVVKEPEGAERHVPTYVYTKDGKDYAKINSLTNSTYALIYNNQSFADAAGKWYENIVSEMASREILFGRDTGVYEGDASITRAEFAAVLVRALGLPANGTSKFTDVASTDWYAGAVGTASGYGLVLGYGDGSFGPNKNITRQEAMAMMQRAAKVAEFSGKTSELTAFSDAASVSDWAISAAQYNVGSGLIVGDNGQLRPNDAITRAESATVVLRLLQKAGLVDVRSAT